MRHSKKKRGKNMNKRHGILLLAIAAAVFPMCGTFDGDITGAIMLAALSMPAFWRS